MWWWRSCRCRRRREANIADHRLADLFLHTEKWYQKYGSGIAWANGSHHAPQLLLHLLLLLFFLFPFCLSSATVKRFSCFHSQTSARPHELAPSPSNLQLRQQYRGHQVMPLPPTYFSHSHSQYPLFNFNIQFFSSKRACCSGLTHFSQILGQTRRAPHPAHQLLPLRHSGCCR